LIIQAERGIYNLGDAYESSGRVQEGRAAEIMRLDCSTVLYTPSHQKSACFSIFISSIQLVYSTSQCGLLAVATFTYLSLLAPFAILPIAPPMTQALLSYLFEGRVRESPERVSLNFLGFERMSLALWC
jgi:hypothetical protein